MADEYDDIDFSIEETEHDNLFDSPEPSRTVKLNKEGSSTPPRQPEKPKQKKAESKFQTEEEREAALKQELANVRKINDVLENVVDSLEKATGNMDACISRISATAPC